MAKKHHTHKYHIINLGKKGNPRKVYACARPDCTHFMPEKRMVVGKKSICWKCLEEFVLDVEVIIKHPRAKPTCFNCRTGIKIKPEEKVEIEKLDAAIEMFAMMRGDIK